MRRIQTFYQRSQHLFCACLVIESHLYLPGSPPLILDVSPARVLTSRWVQTWILLHSYFYQEITKATIDISCFEKMFCKKKINSDLYFVFKTSLTSVRFLTMAFSCPSTLILKLSYIYAFLFLSHSFLRKSIFLHIMIV